MSSSAAPSPLAAARSLLFVPATRPERFAKALASGADAVIVDLEDAVAPADKASARSLLEQAYAQFSAVQRARVLVRVNAAGTPWHMDDLQLLARLAPQGLAGVLLPKAESTVQLHGVAQAVGARCALLPLVETVAGLDAVDTLAKAPQVLRLVFGNLDFQADAGLACGPGEEELVPVRLALVLASRRANLAAAPLDGVTAITQDLALVQAHAQRAQRGGFGGKLCIHPAQVATVNAAFTPSTKELDWARRVLAGFAAAQGGVFTLDGRMVDAPVVRLAQRLLAQADGGAAANDALAAAPPPSVAQQLREFWDKRYARPDYVYGTEPNEFLASPPVRGWLPADGKLLCLADGEGRNSVWLARQGFEVTALDISAEGVAKARRLAQLHGVTWRLYTEVADVTAHELGQTRWDGIVSIFLHLPPGARRALHRRAFAALRPGGVFVWEAYGPEQLGRGTGGPPDPALLPPLADVAADFDGLAGCELLHQWTGVRRVVEGPLHTGEGFVTQLVLRKQPDQ
jgi:citrate lyase subunit beta/citryl-CoA lyase